MANKVLWLAETPATLLSTELNALANAGMAIDGADYDNATNRFQQADFVLFLDDFAAPPTAGGYFELHIFYKHDGTKYADGFDGDADADSLPTAATLVRVFPVSASDNDQYIQQTGVPLSPYAFRVAVVNKCGQALSAADTHFLKMYPYSLEVQ